jgi:CRP-like cAMP-binding protein
MNSFFPAERHFVTPKQTTDHLDNRLLAAMPPAVFALFSPHLREKIFQQGSILQEPAEPIERIFFPQSGMISLLVVTQDGGGIEAATIGREGSAGLQSGLGKRRAFTRAVTQVGGTFSYIAADRFRAAVEKSDAIKDVITRYTELMLAESQQVSACNAKHHAEARLSRWLLQTRDRIESDTLPLTQEFLSEMLGVRRTTVTLVARALQTAGLIKYRRGSIHLLDVEGLKNAACECYAATDQESLPQRLGVDFSKS